MAKIFQFTPEQVDSMDFERVQNMLHLDGEWRKKENEDGSKHLK